MNILKIGVLHQNADAQLRASFVRKFGVHLAMPQFIENGSQASYGRHDGRKITPEQREFILAFVDGWRSCAFTFDRLLKDKQNWADNPLEG